MAAPKSTVRVLTKNGKTEIRYEDNVDASQYYLHELNRAALRDVGRFVKKKFKQEYYSHFKKRTGKGPKAVKCQVMASKSTVYPRLEIGLPHGSRGNKIEGFYSFFQEFGSINTPRLGLLQNIVKDNTAEIIKIESQYLSALSGEASRLESLIHEGDMEVEDED